MTRRQWIIIIALIALVCAVYAALASLVTTGWSHDLAGMPSAPARPVDNVSPILPSTPPATLDTATPAPAELTDTPTSMPTAQTPEPTLAESTATTTVIPSWSSTPSPSATLTRSPDLTSTPAPTVTPTFVPAPGVTSTRPPSLAPTPSPAAPPAPQPTAMARGGTLLDTLMNPFAGEAYRRRSERARLDPDYYRRVDQKLSQDRVNFLLFGYGETHEPPVAVDVIIGSLSILSYDLRTGRVDIISLTHDTRAPEIERFLAQRGRPSGPVKIDQAYSVGGFDLMRKTVESATGLSIDFQIVFKDALLIKLVDNVWGGIAIDNPADFKVQPFYLDGKLFEEGHFGQGRQQINGTQAVQYIKALTARHDPALERNVRKVIVFRALLDGANARCHDRDFWLRVSSFVVGQSSSQTIQYDFDPLGLLVSHLGEVISGVGKFAQGEGCDLGASRIGKTLYVVDPTVGDGGVQWVSMEVLSNPIAKRDLESGVYPQAGAGMELPLNSNPYGDLITGYWPSVRRLVKQSLARE